VIQSSERLISPWSYSAARQIGTGTGGPTRPRSTGQRMAKAFSPAGARSTQARSESYSVSSLSVERLREFAAGPPRASTPAHRRGCRPIREVWSSLLAATVSMRAGVSTDFGFGLRAWLWHSSASRRPTCIFSAYG
jgi:hypothetical protein